MESKGYIRLEAFKLLLETHKVRLAPKTLKQLKLAAGDPSLPMKDDRILFEAALRIVQPNMEADDPLNSEWVIEGSSFVRPF